MGEHRLDDGFAAIRGPCPVSAGSEAGAPIGETEASEGQLPLKFEQMLAAGFGPAGVFSEQRWIDADLSRDEGEHRRGRRFRRVQHPARMMKRTKLDGEAQPIARATPGSHERQIVGTENIMAGHLGWIGRDTEQPDSLIGRQQGARGHVGLRLAVGTRS
jgi:hypothetical protein